MVICYLLILDLGKKKYPVVIVLRGHSTGLHNAIKEPKYPQDNPENEPNKINRTFFVVQTVKQGYIAPATERRGMGERVAKNGDFRRVSLINLEGCYFKAVTALLLGRSL